MKGEGYCYDQINVHQGHAHDFVGLVRDRAQKAYAKFGWILAGSHGRQLRIGMTEDLEPKGPAVDLVFRLGAGF